jgi:hypothetical protein
MKPLAFSYSKIKNFRTCPKRHYHYDISRDVKEPESDALAFGNFFHAAMEKRFLNGERMPLTILRYEHWGRQLDAWRHSHMVKVEQKLAFDKSFNATEYFDRSTWFRSRLDVVWFPPEYKRTAVVMDWKTGEVKPDEQQLQLSAQAIFSHYPHIDVVVASYIWVGDDTDTTRPYTRDDMPGLWSSLYPEIKVMEEAYRTTTYPPKPSGLCKRFCAVVSCPYHGKGLY